MNCCWKCALTQRQIVAQFDVGPTGFVNARTVPNTRNILVGRKLLQTNTSTAIIAIILEEDRRMTCDEIVMASGIPKSFLRLVLIEVSGKRKVGDNARLHIAQTVLSDYKAEAMSDHSYSPDMRPPDCSPFPQLDEPAAWPMISVFRSAECSRGQTYRTAELPERLEAVLRRERNYSEGF